MWTSAHRTHTTVVQMLNVQTKMELSYVLASVDTTAMVITAAVNLEQRLPPVGIVLLAFVLVWLHVTVCTKRRNIGGV